MFRRKKEYEEEEPEDVKKMLADFIRGFWLIMKVLLVVLILSPIFISSQGKGFLAKGMSYLVDMDTLCQPCVVCDAAPEVQKGSFEKKDVSKQKEAYRGNGGI